jgi:hypothetical protein
MIVTAPVPGTLTSGREVTVRATDGFPAFGIIQPLLHTILKVSSSFHAHLLCACHVCPPYCIAHRCTCLPFFPSALQNNVANKLLEMRAPPPLASTGRFSYKTAPSSSEGQAIVSYTAFACAAARATPQLRDMRAALARPSPAPSPPPPSSLGSILGTVTSLDARGAIESSRLELLRLRGHRDEVAKAHAAVGGTVGPSLAPSAAAPEVAAPERAPLGTPHAALATSLAAVTASFRALEERYDALVKRQKAQGRDGQSAEEAVTEATVLARAVESEFALALARDAQLLEAVRPRTVAVAIDEFRELLADDALRRKFDELMVLARLQQPLGGAADGGMRGSARGPMPPRMPATTGVKPGAPPASALSAFPDNVRGAVASGEPFQLEAPVNGAAAVVCGFRRSPLITDVMCWLYSMTQALAASSRVRRAVAQAGMTAPSFASPASALQSMVAAATGAFQLTAGQVYLAARAITSRAFAPVDLARSQSLGDALSWALSVGDPTSDAFRALLVVQSSEASEPLNSHDLLCPHAVDEGLGSVPRITSFTDPALVQLSGAEVATVACEEAVGQCMQPSTFSSRFHPLPGAPKPPAGAISIAQLANHRLACTSQPRCEPAKAAAPKTKPQPTCGKLVTYYLEMRYHAAPPVIAFTTQLEQNLPVHLEQRMLLTGVGPEVTHLAASASVPVVHCYQLVAFSQLAGASRRVAGHYTTTFADGTAVVLVNDEAVTRTAGQPLARAMPGCALAVYELCALPAELGDGQLPATPRLLSHVERLKDINSVIFSNEPADFARALVPRRTVKLAAIDLTDDTDDEDAGGAAATPATAAITAGSDGSAGAAAGASARGGVGDAAGVAAAVAAGEPHAPARGVGGRKRVRVPSRRAAAAAAAAASEGGASSSSAMASEVAPRSPPRQRLKGPVRRDEGGGGEMDDEGEDAVDEEGGGGEGGGRGEEEDEGGGFKRLSKKALAARRRAAAQLAQQARRAAQQPRAHGEARKKKKRKRGGRT